MFYLVIHQLLGLRHPTRSDMGGRIILRVIFYVGFMNTLGARPVSDGAILPFATAGAFVVGIYVEPAWNNGEAHFQDCV